jgi:hypothetical protein
LHFDIFGIKMLALYRINFLILVFLVFTSSYSQTEKPVNFAINGNIHYGFNLPEYKFFNGFVNSPVTSAELSLQKKTTGKNLWSQLYGYPEYGLSIFFSSLGSSTVLGNEVAIYPYFQNYIVRRKKFHLTTTIGTGLGYATKRFDLITNPQNVAVGSHFNIHFNFKLGARWLLTERLGMQSGLSFSHFSNGNTAEPNLGINFLTGFVGLQYDFSKNIVRQTNIIPLHEKKHEMAFVYAAGGKRTRALQSNYYFTSSWSAEYRYHWKRKFHFGAGLDLFYDSSTKTELKAVSKSEYQPRYDHRTGIHLSEAFIYERFSFILQQGVYLGLIDQVNKSSIYNRAILRWKFNDHILANFSLKSHLHILEYPELGIGYYFTSKK